MGIRLEIGKKYVCRNRPDIKYVNIVKMGGTYYYGDIVYFYGNIEKSSWCQDGAFTGYGVSEIDLVQEYSEEFTISELQAANLKHEKEVASRIPSMPFKYFKINTDGGLDIDADATYLTKEEAIRLTKALAKFYIREMLKNE